MKQKQEKRAHGSHPENCMCLPCFKAKVGASMNYLKQNQDRLLLEVGKLQLKIQELENTINLLKKGVAPKEEKEES